MEVLEDDGGARPGLLVQEASSASQEGSRLLFVLAGRRKAKAGAEREAPEDPAATRLTPAERRVVARLLKGRTAKETADDLGVATGTVRRHVQNIYGKLGVSNRIQLARAVQDLER